MPVTRWWVGIELPSNVAGGDDMKVTGHVFAGTAKLVAVRFKVGNTNHSKPIR